VAIDSAIFLIEYDYAAYARSTKFLCDLASGSLLVRAYHAGARGNVLVADEQGPSQTATSGTTLACQWRGRPPGRTLAFDGDQRFARLIPKSNAANLAAPGDVTMEAWCKPGDIADKARLIQQRSGDSNYTLGLLLRYRYSALELNYKTPANDQQKSFVQIPSSRALKFAGAITLEAWIKPKSVAGAQYIVYHAVKLAGKVFLRIRGGKYEVGSAGADDVESFASAPMSNDADTWVHLAGAYDDVAKCWLLYRNGIEMGRANSTTGAVALDSSWVLGARPDTAKTLPSGLIDQAYAADLFSGHMDEVRIWNLARSRDDIDADKGRPLGGNDLGLVGCWRFYNSVASDHSLNRNDGRVLGNNWGNNASPLPFYAVFAGVGEQYVQTKEREFIAGGRWNHLAAVFNQSYALRFDGKRGDYLDCGNDITLDLNRDLTIEVFLDPDPLRRPLGILAKGVLADGSNKQDVPYQLSLDGDGMLVFAFEDTDHVKHIVASAEAVPMGFCKLAATRRHVVESAGDAILVYDAIKLFINARPAKLKASGSGDLADEDKTYKYKGKSAGSNTLPLEIGRAHLEGAQESMFKGVISEVRLWNAAREPKDVCGDINGSEKGLVSWWRFEENDGNTATDSKSNNHARIKGDVEWVKNPDPNGSQLALYVNGVGAPLLRPKKEDFIAAETQFALGALDNATVTEKFQGELEEVRIWKTVRTAEQIQDNLFRRLTGEKEDLIAHYTFDVAPNEVGTVAATHGQVSSLSVPSRVRRDLRADTILWLGGTRVTVSQDVNADADTIPIRKTQVDVPDGTPIFEMTVPDHALRGNHLQLTAQPSEAMFVLSTAPVSEDTPQIRSALAGIKTDFNDTMHGRPAVTEYGEMQYDVDGNLIGILKRCYGIIKDGQWQIITAYKVGDLLTEWVGQVQFAPQLIGYIEGAPPVPSENLTTRSVEAIGDQDDYNEASVVEIVEAKRTTFTYSAEKESGYDLSLDLSARAGIKSESLGGPIVAVTSLEETNIKVGLKSGMEYSQSWLKDASTAVGKTVSRSTSLELRGRFETPEEAAQPALGRRFIPENVGLALVQSETADVFALRLQSNNALISYQMRPNPDIPKDWNIITFPINPRYTKQGTLDGKIGFRPDPNYPNALTYSPDSSYFKPIEAYALKNRIQRDEEELRTFYEQVSPTTDVSQVGGMAMVAGALVALTGGMSGGIGPAVGGGGLGYLANEMANATVDSLPRLEKRNIVNTYVWTADGGLFAETQETMDVWQETTGGAFNASAHGGLSLTMEGAVSKVAYEFELEAMLGAHLSLTLKKSRETENTFAVNVTLGKVERDIYERDEKGFTRLDRTDPRNPKPIKTPGKVDAYRFMTFYLEPRTDNFDLFFNRVVDSVWLEQSDDPSAVALREARQDAFKPPCWRVMHRVTYVSRTLQPFTDAPASALDKAMQDLNVASNYELIKVLEPFVRDKRGFVAFADAVRQALRTYLPELEPHAETIVTYASLYFGVIDEEGIGAGETTPLGAPSASAPAARMSLEAGADQLIRMEQGAVLLGEIANAAADAQTRWSMVSGPDTVTFDDAAARATVAHFRRRGVYRLRLTATNAAGSVADELTVTVNEAPVVEAGQNQVVNLNGKAELVGAVSDSGLGNPRGSRVTTRWEMVSGPAAAKFDNVDALATTVTFDKAGSYLLRFTADNGTHSASDELVVNVVGRVVDGLRALYAFEDGDGEVIRDVSGVGTSLDLTVGDRTAVTRVNGGMRVESPTTLASHGPADKISDAIRASGELTVEAWIKPVQNSDGDLGRIVTISDGRAGRNLTLGQGNGRFYAGLRTTTTDLNASNKALTGNVATSGELAHLVCTRDASGLTRLYLNAVEIAARKVGGDFSNWDAGFKLALASEPRETDARQTRHAWQGEYHLLALYSRALRLEEIRQNFAFQADTNLAPAVEAGADQVIDLPAKAQLSGRVTDNRLQTDALKVTWAKLSGPGGVTFATPTALTTAAEFARSGVYLLQLTVADEELSNSDTVTVVVHQAPTIRAGVTLAEADQPLLLTGASITVGLEGTIVGTGLGEPGPGQVSILWGKTDGPGAVKFEDVHALNTKVTFSKQGVSL
jgi:PKD repeat protein